MRRALGMKKVMSSSSQRTTRGEKKTLEIKIGCLINIQEEQQEGRGKKALQPSRSADWGDCLFRTPW